MNQDDVSRENLREATLAGVRWVTLGRIVAETAAFGSVVVLARLITPAEFGAVAVALILNALAVSIAGQGFGAPLVQRHTVERRHLESAALLSLLSGALLTVVMFMLAPLAGPLFGERIAAIAQLTSPIFLVVSIGVVANAQLQRRLEFRRTTIIEVVSVTVGIVVSLVLAIAGLDAEALVLGALAKTVLSSLLLLLATPLVVPRWHTAAAREVAAFGGPAAGASIAYSGFRNVDYAIIAAQLGAAQVGFYWRAYQLCFDYQHKITGVMQRIAFPVLSRSRDMADMRAIRYRIVRVHAVAIFPLLFLVVATAPALIPWVFGPQWEPAVTPAQILGFAALATPVLTGVGALLLAAGRPRELMVANWASTAGLAGAVFIAAPHGIVAVSFAVLGVQAVKFVLLQRFLLGPIIGLTPRDLWKEAAPGLLSGVALLTTAGATTQLLLGAGAPNVVAFAAAGATGGFTYLLVLNRAFGPAWADLALLVGRVFRPSRSATPGPPRRLVAAERARAGGTL